MEKISAIMPLNESHWTFAQRAVQDFVRQDFKGAELICVTPHRNLVVRLQAVVRALSIDDRSRVRVYERPAPSFGFLFLYGLALANNGIIAVWDADNLNHPERLTRQLGQMGNAQASALTRTLYWNEAERSVSFCDFDALTGDLADSVVPTTLLFRRDCVAPINLTMPSGETPATRLTDQLKQDLIPVGDSQFLHVVSINANNRRGLEKHQVMMADKSIGERADLLPGIVSFPWARVFPSVEGLAVRPRTGATFPLAEIADAGE